MDPNVSAEEASDSAESSIIESSDLLDTTSRS